MQTFSHKCIKCEKPYKDADFDDYLCRTCLAEKMATAKILEKQYNTVGQQPNGLLAQYDAARQGRKFPRAKDVMGI